MVSIPAPVTQMKTEFERARRWRRTRQEPMQFGDLRCEALDRFLSLEFPTTADPEWRFTNINTIGEKLFTLSLPSPSDEKYNDLGPVLVDDSDMELVFVNGYCARAASKALSIPLGVRVQSVSEVLDSSPSEIVSYLGRVARFERRAFVALNTALFNDGGCILIPPHTVLEKPVYLRFISNGEADMRPAISNPRVFVLLGEGSRAAVVEEYVGRKDVEYLTNTVTEVVLGKNASLEHYKVQFESTDAYHTSATNVIASSGANWSRHYIGIGGGLIRDEIGVVLGGNQACCNINGLYIVDGGRLTDSHTAVEHANPHCSSRQLYTGIVADFARGVFNGTTVVGASAHSARAKQTSQALVLSKDARIHTASHFENSAKDIHYTHRAITRRIDDAAALYTSRGLSAAGARRSAILSFARKMLKDISLQQLAQRLEPLVVKRLEPILASLDSPDDIS